MTTLTGCRTGAASWCILWTRAPHTLALATSLNENGIEAWAPSRTVQRDAPGARRRLHLGQPRVTVEVSLPILPRFVFAAADRLGDLFLLSEAAFSDHPAFRVFHGPDGAPIVSEGDLRPLRDAEAVALAEITAARDADTREAARQERAKRLGTERARRKALSRERRDLARGADVTVDDMPALAGMVGQVVQGQGTTAVIHFGGSLTMTVEAWRVRPVELLTDPALTGTAA
jgi:hypothetical protein